MWYVQENLMYYREKEMGISQDPNKYNLIK